MIEKQQNEAGHSKAADKNCRDDRQRSKSTSRQGDRSKSRDNRENRSKAKGLSLHDFL